MKVMNLLPFVALASTAALSLPPPPPPVPDVQTLPSVTRKDAILKRIRYGPHTLKKAMVRKMKDSFRNPKLNKILRVRQQTQKGLKQQYLPQQSRNLAMTALCFR
jgi:hypothetical protein